jgi:hypothetical protein
VVNPLAIRSGFARWSACQFQDGHQGFLLNDPIVRHLSKSNLISRLEGSHDKLSVAGAFDAPYIRILSMTRILSLPASE